MEKEELKQYLVQNLRINAYIVEQVFEEEGYNLPDAKRLVITLSLGREVINETKVWI